MNFRSRSLGQIRRHFSTVNVYNPNIQPYSGLSELNSSTRRLNVNNSDIQSKSNFSQSELNRIANLSYLQAPSTDAEVNATVESLNKVVSWLSQITSVDTVSMPRPRGASVRVVKAASEHVDTDCVHTPSSLPPFSPLQALALTVPVESVCVGGALRVRDDSVEEGDIAATLLNNAPNHERGYYVVPQAVDGEE